MKTLFLTTLLLLTSSVFASGMAKYKCVLPAVHEWEEESVFYISQSEEFMCGNRDADASLAVSFISNEISIACSLGVSFSSEIFDSIFGFFISLLRMFLFLKNSY